MNQGFQRSASQRSKPSVRRGTVVHDIDSRIGLGARSKNQEKSTKQGHTRRRRKRTRSSRARQSSSGCLGCANLREFFEITAKSAVLRRSCASCCFGTSGPRSFLLLELVSRSWFSESIEQFKSGPPHQETLNTVSHLWLFQEDQQGHDSDTQKDHDEL